MLGLPGVREMPQVRWHGACASQSAYPYRRDLRNGPRQFPNRNTQDMSPVLWQRCLPSVQGHGEDLLISFARSITGVSK
jgi:hypothetical protein